MITDYDYSCSKLRYPTKGRDNRLFLWGTWLVPLFVWIVVIAIVLAIAGLLLGEE